MSKFKKGDRVYLAPTSGWVDGTIHNPIDTLGVVLDYVYGLYRVRWGVSITNGKYSDDDLILEKDNPVAGLRRMYTNSPDYINYEVDDE